MLGLIRTIRPLGLRSERGAIGAGNHGHHAEPRRAVAFRDDLVRHRARSALNDAEYVREILRVSLNTFKKCVAPGRSLTMKRRVFNTIVANTGLDATRYGLDSAVAATPMNYGGYRQGRVRLLVGRYLIYRRHFQNGGRDHAGGARHRLERRRERAWCSRSSAAAEIQSRASGRPTTCTATSTCTPGARHHGPASPSTTATRG